MSPSTDQHWSSVYRQGRDFRLISASEVDRCLSYVTPEAPKTCLDLGCGTGQLSRELYHRGYRVLGIDASSEAVVRAKNYMVPNEQLSYVQADLEEDFRDELKEYGLITCKLVYAFIKDKPAFLERVASLLHSQGIFVVITPMLEDVEETKKEIATSEEDIKLLDTYFKRSAIYRENGLTYYVGCPVLKRE